MQNRFIVGIYAFGIDLTREMTSPTLSFDSVFERLFGNCSVRALFDDASIKNFVDLDVSAFMAYSPFVANRFSEKLCSSAPLESPSGNIGYAGN